MTRSATRSLATLLVVAAAVALPARQAARAAAGPMFGAQAYRLPTLGPVGSLTFADLNGDGAPDLVVGTEGPGGVGVAMGTGGGKFGPFGFSFVSTRAVYLLTGDFDGDGHPDVAGARFLAASGDSASVFLACGDGVGGWASYREWPTRAYAHVVAGDVNHDGLADLVAVSADSVAVYFGRSDRSLELNSEFPSGGASNSPELAGLTGDSNLDLLLVRADTALVSLFPGNGDGAFGPRVDSPSGPSLSRARAVPMASGLPRIVLTGLASATQAALPGGAFATPDTVPLGQSEAWGGLCIADLDGDGKLDYLTFQHTGANAMGFNLLAAHLGDGQGDFGPPLLSRDSGIFANSMVRNLTDLDGDGRLDVAYGSDFSDDAAIVLGNGDGTFGPPQPANVPGIMRGVACGDFDEDGKPDAVSVLDGGQLAFAHGMGNGTFAPIVLSANAPADGNELAAADLDQDGHLDLVGTGGSTGNTLSWLKGDGHGNFGAPVTFPTGSTPSGLTLADVNSDGKLDAVVPCSGGSELDVCLQGASGLLAPSVQTVPAGPYAVRYSDLNHDGKMDRVVACTVGLVAQLNDGAGGYLPAVTHALANPPGDFALADLDGDGALDAVVLRRNTFPLDPHYNVLRGHADGSFDLDATINGSWNPFVPSASGFQANRVLAGDFDGDGRIDLLLVDGAGNMNLVALRGNGDRTFGLPEVMRCGLSIGASRDVLADLDGDGRPDIVGGGTGTVGHVSTSTFYSMLNRTGGVTAVGPTRVAPRAHAELALSPAAPNPSAGRFTLTLTAAHAGLARLGLYSPSGREVYARGPIALVAGANQVTLDAPGLLSDGVYWVRATQGNAQAVSKVVVLGR